jgi:zinc transport system substrate-binding protein
MLKDARGKPFIVSHDATRYFEERFELRAIASIEPAGGGAPGMKRLLSLVKLAREHPGICVFVTPDAPRAYAAMLKREAGARTALIDPAGALLEPGAELYPKLLENLASAFSECLKGAN